MAVALVANLVRYSRAARIRLEIRLRKGKRRVNTTTFNRDARDSQLTKTFRRISSIPGWFVYDDCVAFTLLSNIQHMMGITGDVLEIGSYHGRSACLLATLIYQSERLVICDPFDGVSTYSGRQSDEATVRRRILEIRPDIGPSLDVRACLSSSLNLTDADRFRLIHIDGSHRDIDVQHDLDLARAHCLPGGVLIIDDYDHPDWPEVTAAVDRFRANHREFAECGDFNRHSESGRKLYLMRQPSSTFPAGIGVGDTAPSTRTMNR